MIRLFTPASASARRARIIAIFMMSAALPWIGAFNAARSAASRAARFVDFSAGKYRLRPNIVSVYPRLRASLTQDSKKSCTLPNVAKYFALSASASLGRILSCCAKPYELNPYASP